MKLKVGNAYIAESENDPSKIWTFRIVYERKTQNGTIFLGVKLYVDVDGDHPQSWWFDENGNSLPSSWHFKLMRISKSKAL